MLARVRSIMNLGFYPLIAKIEKSLAYDTLYTSGLSLTLLSLTYGAIIESGANLNSECGKSPMLTSGSYHSWASPTVVTSRSGRAVLNDGGMLYS